MPGRLGLHAQWTLSPGVAIPTAQWRPGFAATPMTASDDLSALIARVALQDRAAFERVYHATCAHLLGVALRILNNRERAEEVLQEAFVNVWHGARC